jgi:hypothetical protein
MEGVRTGSSGACRDGRRTAASAEYVLGGNPNGCACPQLTALRRSERCLSARSGQLLWDVTVRRPRLARTLRCRPRDVRLAARCAGRRRPASWPRGQQPACGTGCAGGRGHTSLGGGAQECTRRRERHRGGLGDVRGGRRDRSGCDVGANADEHAERSDDQQQPGCRRWRASSSRSQLRLDNRSWLHPRRVLAAPAQ